MAAAALLLYSPPRGGGTAAAGPCGVEVPGEPLEGAELVTPPFIDLLSLDKRFQVAVFAPRGVEGLSIRGVYVVDALGAVCSVDWGLNTSGWSRGRRVYVLDVWLARGFFAPLAPARLLVETDRGFVEANLSMLGPPGGVDENGSLVRVGQPRPGVVAVEAARGRVAEAALLNCGVRVAPASPEEGVEVDVPGGCGPRLTLYVVLVDGGERLVVYAPVELAGGGGG